MQVPRCNLDGTLGSCTLLGFQAPSLVAGDYFSPAVSAYVSRRDAGCVIYSLGAPDNYVPPHARSLSSRATCFMFHPTPATTSRYPRNGRCRVRMIPYTSVLLTTAEVLDYERNSPFYDVCIECNVDLVSVGPNKCGANSCPLPTARPRSFHSTTRPLLCVECRSCN